MVQVVGLVSRFDDVVGVCHPIQQRGGHRGVAEYIRPFRKAGLVVMAALVCSYGLDSRKLPATLFYDCEE